MNGFTTLYRMYNDGDQLLYVGIAGNPARRFNEHDKTKPWWHEVSYTRTEHFDARLDAVCAERNIIKSENPLYNIVHHPNRVVPPRAERTPGAANSGIGAWAWLEDDGAQKLREADFQGFDFDLFLYLWSTMRYQNYLTVNQSKLAAKLDVNRVQVNRSIRKFVKAKVLFPGLDSVTYRLSPRIGYRGNRTEHNAALQQLQNGYFEVVDGGPIE